MSAITGIFYRNGKIINPELIEEMNNKLSHRGNDGSAIFCDGQIAFGHQMLWTTSESLHEKLPFHDEKNGLIITSDARIDNRKELSKELGIEDKENIPDSIFILKSYIKWGEKCSERLLGDFAFAIWDKNNETLFCARDYMGVKPFYYFLSDEKFVFATEIKALFNVPKVPYELNELKVGLYLKMDIEDKKSTFYTNILSLTAANFISINKKSYVKKQYWKLNPKKEILMDTDEEYFKAYQEIFSEAVNCRLRSVFPIGFDLSGGLDSSSVVCVAKKIIVDKNSQNYLETFSQFYEDFRESDERYYINKVVSSGGIKPTYVKCDNINLLDDIENILIYQDQPFSLPFLTIFSAIFQRMELNGSRIHLNGVGGDIVISHGQNYFLDLSTKFKFKKLFREVKFSSKRHNNFFYIEYMKNLIFPIIPFYFKKVIIYFNNFYKVHIIKQEQIFGKPKNFLNPDFARQIKLNDFKAEKTDLDMNELSNAKKTHYNSLNNYSLQEDFETREKLASKFNIESRFPYYDKRMVEFCYAIPTEIKFKYGWDRYIQRASMENIIPKEIQWRPYKTNLMSVLKTNLFLFETKRLENIIDGKEELINKYINLPEIRKIYDKYKLDNSIAYIHVLHLWQIILLSEWLKLLRGN